MIYKDQLEAVYRLIEKPEAWTQRAFARNDGDQTIDDEYDCNDEGRALSDEECATHPDARCWCLYGAAYKTGIDDDLGFTRALGMKVLHEVSDFNDSHTHGEVLDLLKSAIERAPVRP